MKNLIFILLCFVLFISCEKETVEVDKVYSWKLHDGFQYNDVAQMNSHSTLNRLYFLGYYSFTSLVPESQSHPDLPFGGNIAQYGIFYDQTSDKKLPICDNYFILYSQSNGWLSFKPNKNPVSSSSSVLVLMDDLDSTFSNFEFISFIYGSCIEINSKEQALIPYLSYDKLKSELKLLLVDIKVTNDGVYDIIDTVKTKIIPITDDFQNDVIAIESVGEVFFLTTDSKVYRIDKEGNITSVLDNRLYKIVESAGKLYGFGSNNLFMSSDNGHSWTQGVEIQNDFTTLCYTKIDDTIIGYRYAQIFQLSFNGNEMIVKELVNDGLVGKTITSVSEFQNKVYVTTLSGVYYKSIDEFYKVKELK